MRAAAALQSHSSNGMRLCAIVLSTFVLFGTTWLPVAADTNSDVVKGLVTKGAYITPLAPPSAHIRPGDINRLLNQEADANSKGVPERIAIVSHLPSNYRSTAAAADGLRNYLQFSGVLILASPRGIGISSDQMSQSEMNTIARKSLPLCKSISYTDCALNAAVLSVTQVRADKNSSFHDAAVFWLVLLVVLGLIILAVVLVLNRRRKVATGRLDELKKAASNTLSMADDAVNEIERSGLKLTPDARMQYDRALGLRDTAKRELETGTTQAQLTQANQDAAQAVLGLQGVMRSAGVKSDLISPLDTTEHRCFYCGRTDRPPYMKSTIDDGKGNSMDIEVCAVDAQQLQRGQTPQITTVQHGGMAVPWWAVPGNPWYYSYGGPSWQYWLPFMIGMDVGGWFGGGWGGYGYGGPYEVNNYYGDSGVDTGSGNYGDAVGVPADAGGADFGGWGSDSTDSGGWGGDSGGWGGDSGGWGGDTGGGDWGGGGDSGGGDSGGWG